MKGKIVLTNTYSSRRKAAEKFKMQYVAIVRFLKTKLSELRSIDVSLTETQFEGKDRTMAYVWIVILNTTTMNCVFLKVKSNAKMYFLRSSMDKSFKSAEKIVQSRYFESDKFSEKGSEKITIKHLLSQTEMVIPYPVLNKKVA